MTPTVSIVVPCFGGEAFLGEALQSCLSQDYDSLEVVIVDDASPDACGRIADGFAMRDARVRVIHHTRNRGVAEALNSGFNAAKGEFLARLAQDDRFAPHAIRVLFETLASADIDMVYADMEYIDAKGSVTGTFVTLPLGEALEGCNGIGVCWLFRRSVWEREARGFDPRFDQVEDFEFWMRARKHSRLIRYDGPPLLQFRQHRDSGTSRHLARMQLLAAEVMARDAGTPAEARRARALGAFGASWACRCQGQWPEARRLAARALFLWPLNLRHWRNLVGVLLHRRPTGP